MLVPQPHGAKEGLETCDDVGRSNVLWETLQQVGSCKLFRGCMGVI